MRKLSDTQLLNFIQNYKVDIKLGDLEPHPVHANKFEIKFIALIQSVNFYKAA